MMPLGPSGLNSSLKESSPRSAVVFGDGRNVNSLPLNIGTCASMSVLWIQSNPMDHNIVMKVRFNVICKLISIFHVILQVEMYESNVNKRGVQVYRPTARDDLCYVYLQRFVSFRRIDNSS